jgi:hypothetical protein
LLRSQVAGRFVHFLFHLLQISVMILEGTVKRTSSPNT